MSKPQALHHPRYGQDLVFTEQKVSSDLEAIANLVILVGFDLDGIDERMQAAKMINDSSEI